MAQYIVPLSIVKGREMAVFRIMMRSMEEEQEKLSSRTNITRRTSTNISIRDASHKVEEEEPDE